MKKKTLFPKQALSVKLNAKEVRLLLFLCNRKINFFDMKSATRREIVKTNKKITLEKEFETLISNKLINQDGSNLNFKKDGVPFIGIPIQRLENIKNNKQLFIMSLDCRNKNKSISYISFGEISLVFGTNKIRDIKLNLNQLKKNMNVKFDYTIDELSNRFTFFDMDLDMNKEDVERKIMKKKSKVKLTTQEEILMKQAMQIKATTKPTMKDELEDKKPTIKAKDDDWGVEVDNTKYDDINTQDVVNEEQKEVVEPIIEEESTISFIHNLVQEQESKEFKPKYTGSFKQILEDNKDDEEEEFVL